jgi:hypothetical protein
MYSINVLGQVLLAFEFGLTVRARKFFFSHFNHILSIYPLKPMLYLPLSKNGNPVQEEKKTA